MIVEVKCKLSGNEIARYSTRREKQKQTKKQKQTQTKRAVAAVESCRVFLILCYPV